MFHDTTPGEVSYHSRELPFVLSVPWFPCLISTATLKILNAETIAWFSCRLPEAERTEIALQGGRRHTSAPGAQRPASSNLSQHRILLLLVGQSQHIILQGWASRCPISNV